MLGKPYAGFYANDKNRYYTLQVGDTVFLATETIIRYGYTGKKELTQSIKLMPIYAPILMLLPSVLSLKKTGEKSFGGATEETFEPLDITWLKVHLKELTESVTDESRFDYTASTNSPAIAGLIAEHPELQLLTVEKLDTFSRVAWLVRTDQFGKLTVQSALLAGRDAEKLITLDTFVFSRELIGQLLQRLEKIQNTQRRN